MTVRVNLLPHREERRKRARIHCAVLGGMTAALGLVIVGAGWFVLSQKISGQPKWLTMKAPARGPVTDELANTVAR